VGHGPSKGRSAADFGRLHVTANVAPREVVRLLADHLGPGALFDESDKGEHPVDLARRDATRRTPTLPIGWKMPCASMVGRD
jgi:hypothetical protein